MRSLGRLPIQSLRRAVTFAAVFAVVAASATLSLGQEANNRRNQKRNRASQLDDARTEVYRRVGDVELKLYFFEPEGDADVKRPAIVFFFGGGWRSGSPTQFVPQAKYLASRGIVVACADYRVNSRHGVDVADCVEDAKAAIRYVRENAERLGIDPQRIASGGGSAGGHLAAAVGTLPGFDGDVEAESAEAELSRPNAMLLFNPALDLTAKGFGADRSAERLTELHARLGGEPQALSPTLHVADDTPPTAIFHGTADATVPYRQAEEFAQAMRTHDNRCDLNGFDGAGHGFFNFGRGDGDAFVETMRQADAFLASLGWLEGEPTIDSFRP